jgi:hypothetical protein
MYDLEADLESAQDPLTNGSKNLAPKPISTLNRELSYPPPPKRQRFEDDQYVDFERDEGNMDDKDDGTYAGRSTRSRAKGKEKADSASIQLKGSGRGSERGGACGSGRGRGRRRGKGKKSVIVE